MNYKWWVGTTAEPVGIRTYTENYVPRPPSDRKIVIVGTVRNCANELKNSIPDAIRLANEFQEYKIILYENDSEDNTVEVVNNFAAKNKNITLITEKNIPGQRTERLAHGRNILLNEVRQKYNHYDFMIVIDLDYNKPNHTKSLRTVIEKMPDHWGAVTATSKIGYYDWWALRSSNLGLDYDCWHPPDGCTDACACGRNPMNTGDLRQIIKEKDRKVESAFNGIGIYRINAIPEDAKYVGIAENGDDVCEHVSFNRKIENLYILPELHYNREWFTLF